MGRASTHLRRFKPAIAIAVIAAFAASQPAMLVSMAHVPLAGAHAAHAARAAEHAGAPHHHALPLQCCSLCSLACSGMIAVPGAPAALTARAPVRPAAAAAREQTRRRAPSPHRLPFALGPPTLRFA